MALKLEIGKTYVDGEGERYKIVTDAFKGYGTDKTFLGICLTGPGHNVYNSNGEVTHVRTMNLVKEYKEPVVHKRILVWYKISKADGVLVNVFICKDYADNYIRMYNATELKREEITYTEKE